MQESLTIGINGEGCVEKKEAIKKVAKENGMSAAKFLLYLFDEYLKRQTKKSK